MPSDVTDGMGLESFLFSPSARSTHAERVGANGSASQLRQPACVEGLKLQPGVPLAAGYADNGNFVCWDPQDGDEIVQHMCDELDAFGQDYRIEQQSVASGVSIGLVLRVRERVFHSRPSRMWRPRRSLHELYFQGESSGEVVRAVDGHIVFPACCSGLRFQFSSRSLSCRTFSGPSRKTA